MANVRRILTENLGGANPDTFLGNPGELFYNDSTGEIKLSTGSPGGSVVGGRSTGYLETNAQQIIIGPEHANKIVFLTYNLGTVLHTDVVSGYPVPVAPSSPVAESELLLAPDLSNNVLDVSGNARVPSAKINTAFSFAGPFA